jgi:hypothetical protein
VNNKWSAFPNTSKNFNPDANTGVWGTNAWASFPYQQGLEVHFRAKLYAAKKAGPAHIQYPLAESVQSLKMP